ncbi:MAG: hypothetical protein N2Z72_06280 [Bacteroidales bacterium]|nr:hypothetical protein [Bacteroidales bacterium]
MKILITSATDLEINAVKNLPVTEIHYLVTGVGVPLTLSSLLDFLYWHPVDIAFQIGIAGSYRESIAVGSVVLIDMDAFADIAWHRGNEMIPIYASLQNPYFELDGFILSSMYPFKEKGLRAVTVSSPTVDPTSKRWIQKYWNPDVESMEGAAFYLACRMRNVPAVQIRAISNYVGDQRSSWQIPRALSSLRDFAVDFIQKFLK